MRRLVALALTLTFFGSPGAPLAAGRSGGNGRTAAGGFRVAAHAGATPGAHRGSVRPVAHRGSAVAAGARHAGYGSRVAVSPRHASGAAVAVGARYPAGRGGIAVGARYAGGYGGAVAVGARYGSVSVGAYYGYPARYPYYRPYPYYPAYYGPYPYYAPYACYRPFGYYASYAPYAYWPAPYYGAAVVARPVVVGSPATPPPAAVELDVKPKKAQVLVDGTPVGQVSDFDTSSQPLYLSPGEHVLEFVLDGYQTLGLRIDTASGGRYRIDEQMAAGGGSDPRSSPPPQSTPPPPPASAPADETPLDGRLRMEASPADAAVYLDGEFLARADELSRLHGDLAVARGAHTVEVARPGFQTESVTVVVGDEPASTTITLSPSR